MRIFRREPSSHHQEVRPPAGPAVWGPQAQSRQRGQGGLCLLLCHTGCDLCVLYSKKTKPESSSWNPRIDWIMEFRDVRDAGPVAEDFLVQIKCHRSSESETLVQNPVLRKYWDQLWSSLPNLTPKTIRGFFSFIGKSKDMAEWRKTDNSCNQQPFPLPPAPPHQFSLKIPTISYKSSHHLCILIRLLQLGDKDPQYLQVKQAVSFLIEPEAMGWAPRYNQWWARGKPREKGQCGWEDVVLPMSPNLASVAHPGPPLVTHFLWPPERREISLRDVLKRTW